MPRSTDSRSFFDRLIGIRSVNDYRERAEEDRYAELPFNVQGPPVPRPGDLKSAMREQAAVTGAARDLRKEDRREARQGLKQGFFAQLPYLMGILTSNTDAALQGNIMGVAESAERQRAIIERRKHEELERAHDVKLQDTELKARQSERLADQSFRTKLQEEEFEHDAWREKEAGAREAARIAAQQEENSKNRTADMNRSILERTAARVHDKEMAHLTSRLAMDREIAAQNREALPEMLDALVATAESGEDFAKLQELSVRLTKNPYDMEARAYVINGRERLRAAQARGEVTPEQSLSVLTQFLNATAGDALSPPPPGFKALQDLAMGRAEDIARRLEDSRSFFLPGQGGAGPSASAPDVLSGGSSSAPGVIAPEDRQLAVERAKVALSAGPHATELLAKEFDTILSSYTPSGQPISDGELGLVGAELMKGKPHTVQLAIQKQVEQAIARRKEREAEATSLIMMREHLSNESLTRPSPWDTFPGAF